MKECPWSFSYSCPFFTLFTIFSFSFCPGLLLNAVVSLACWQQISCPRCFWKGGIQERKPEGTDPHRVLSGQNHPGGAHSCSLAVVQRRTRSTWTKNCHHPPGRGGGYHLSSSRVGWVCPWEASKGNILRSHPFHRDPNFIPLSFKEWSDSSIPVHKMHPIPEAGGGRDLQKCELSKVTEVPQVKVSRDSLELVPSTTSQPPHNATQAGTADTPYRPPSHGHLIFPKLPSFIARTSIFHSITWWLILCQVMSPGH